MKSESDLLKSVIKFIQLNLNESPVIGMPNCVAEADGNDNLTSSTGCEGLRCEDCVLYSNNGEKVVQTLKNHVKTLEILGE